jgi:hypothetical protein
VATKIIRSPDLPARGGRERLGVFALAGAVVTIVVICLAWSAVGGKDGSRGLLRYQSLFGSLPASDQEQFHALRSALLTAEPKERGRRVATSRKVLPSIPLSRLPSPISWR